MEMLITGEEFDPVERGSWYSPAAVARMIEEARREEREACAQELHKVAGFLVPSPTRSTYENCAQIVRNRGEK